MGSVRMCYARFVNFKPPPGLRSDRGGPAILSWLPRRPSRLPGFVRLATRRHVVHEETGETRKDTKPTTGGV